jgi:hypothetical protein
MAAVHGISRGWQRNLVSTALEAIEVVARNTGGSLEQLVDQYGPSAEPDKILADKYRLGLKRLLYLSWRGRRSLTTSVTHELKCFAEGELVDRNGLLSAGERLGCSPGGPCSLQAHLRHCLADIETLLKSGALNSEKAEIQKRRKVLKDFVRKPEHPIAEDACRKIGDAAFVLFAPKGAAILTTNTVDFLPMAKALGKEVDSPTST